MSQETIRKGHSVITVHSHEFIAQRADQQAQWLARRMEAGDGAARAIVEAAFAVLEQTRRNSTDTTR